MNHCRKKKDIFVKQVVIYLGPIKIDEPQNRYSELCIRQTNLTSLPGLGEV